MEKRYDLHTGVCKTCKKEYFGQGKFFCSRSCLNKGRVRTPETRNKIRLANLGKKLSKETIEKRSQKIIGTKRKDSTKLKISESHIGNKNPMWGKELSIEHRRKIGDSEKGEKHHNWKGGITPENVKIRHSFEYKQWRVSVFERDNYTCTECGSNGVMLNADHIKPFAYFPELRLVVDNGRTLCVPCHKLTDTYGYKVKQFYESTRS